MDTPHLITTAVYAAAVLALCAGVVAWWVWRHAAPMPTNIVRFEELRRTQRNVGPHGGRT